MYYPDVVDVLLMIDDQAISPMLCQLRGWALQAISDLPFRFWLSEINEIVMSLEQNFGIIEMKLSIIRENCDRTAVLEVGEEM